MYTELSKNCPAENSKELEALNQHPQVIKEAARTEYKNERKKLNDLILKSKKENWNQLIADIKEDIWGNAYRIVSKRPFQQQISYDAETQLKAAEELFPKDAPTLWTLRKIEASEIPDIEPNEII
ncbi:hypothetical protein HHI36_000688 [Cryptolaemus montrouzieri]|uniref:Uncharacterized protein n=1 Tax=Cryptolaemus montrouzieri TaxID=559131 RepID=A0ABD2P5U0_9CUCU